MTENGTLGIVGGGNKETPLFTGKSRKYCFTLNNYSDLDLEHLKSSIFLEKISYIIFGKEIAPTTGTPHLQGFFELPNPRSAVSLRKELPDGIWLKPSKGTAIDNYVYCSKDGTDVFQHGVPSTESHGGKREKTKKINIREEAKKIFLVKEYNNVKWKDWQQEVLNILEDEPDNRKIHWYWEDKGNKGKSYLAKWIASTFPGVIVCDRKKRKHFQSS